MKGRSLKLDRSAQLIQNGPKNIERYRLVVTESKHYYLKNKFFLQDEECFGKFFNLKIKKSQISLEFFERNYNISFA